MSIRLIYAARVAVAVAAAALAASCGHTSTPATSIGRIAEATADLGARFVGETVKGSFRLENAGTEPFRIASTSASCSCATAKPDQDTVAPGAGAGISYSMTSAEATSRHIVIKVATDPPSKDPLTFTVTLVWLARIEADPEALAATVLYGEAFERRIPLRLADGISGLTIKAVHVRPERAPFDAGFEPPTDQDELGQLVIHASKGLQPGRYSARLVIDYDNFGLGAQTMPFSLDVESAVESVQSPIVIDFAGQPEVTVPVTLRHITGARFVVRGIRGDNCTIRAPELPREADWTHRIPITFVHTVDDPTRCAVVFDLGPELGQLRVPLEYARPRRDPAPK